MRIYKDYMDLSVTELQEEYEYLSDVLYETETFRPSVSETEPKYIQMLMDINSSTKNKLRKRLEEIRRQARMKGVELD